MPNLPPPRRAAWGALLLCIALPVAAQEPGSMAAERLRLAEITGDTAALRAGRDTAPALARFVAPWAGIPVRIDPVHPELRFVWNSDLPYSLNDGALWAGRGRNAALTAGASAAAGWRGAVVRLTVAPTFTYSENRPFQIFPGTIPGRSTFSNPFHPRQQSIDMPLRFGDLYLFRVDPGRTALTVETRRASVGITAADEWWGPAIRNALVLSTNAPGIPRVFVETNEPVRTAIGEFRAKLFSGVLTESRFFDAQPANDLRSISAALISFRPRFDTSLTVGVTRVVYAPTDGASAVGTATSHAADVLWRWESVTSPADTTPEGVSNQRSDQLASAFVRWVFPQAGFELYGEWARVDLPRSGTELVVGGSHSAAYTLGFQWAQPRRRHDVLRLQAEVTNLEQNLVFPARPPLDYYTARAAVQGYTQRGQVIGAAIGPGASSQWLAVDYFARAWQLGTYIGRVRWENDALYRTDVPTLFKHDVTLLTGLRGGVRTPWSDFAADATFGYRFNYLFQNGFANFGKIGTVDVRNFTVTFSATPR